MLLMLKYKFKDIVESISLQPTLYLMLFVKLWTLLECAHLTPTDYRLIISVTNFTFKRLKMILLLTTNIRARMSCHHRVYHRTSKWDTWNLVESIRPSNSWTIRS